MPFGKNAQRAGVRRWAKTRSLRKLGVLGGLSPKKPEEKRVSIQEGAAPPNPFGV